MAESLLSQSLFGGMPAPTLRLSWSDQRSLEQAAAGAMASAVELRHLRDAVKDVELGQERVGTWIASAVWSLERDLGLRLDQQTAVLVAQRELLRSIDEALRTPAKTRAAERIADTGELLRRGRYDRALAIAQEAIDDDPNNPAGFRAAGWALCGLRRLGEARAAFAECAAASDDDERAEALRQSARLAYLVESPAAALAALAAVDDQMSPEQERAVLYDRAVYHAEDGDEETAGRELALAYQGDSRFALQALNDEVLRRHPALLAGVSDHVRHLIEQLQVATREVDRDLAAVDRAIADLIEEVEDPAAMLRTVRARLRADVSDLRRRRAALDEHADDAGSADALPVNQVQKRARAVRRLARTAEELLAARGERQSAAAAKAAQEEIEREQIQARRRVLDEAINRTIAEAGRKCQVHRSVLDFNATVTASGFLSSAAWNISVDEDLRVSVTPAR
ncbi:MAG TPA: hypothetical protein VFG42_16745 [Baekduia sp.]|uniref:hypothetical protein n=1 Tax=Baekduia sp. TaxID=2600305 RepID=UPI002D78A188|nr:hypothetical protein [Baekduia sp.]HET6508445.1 hypothetical protein [Baekduia sp.]